MLDRSKWREFINNFLPQGCGEGNAQCGEFNYFELAVPVHDTVLMDARSGRTRGGGHIQHHI